MQHEHEYLTPSRKADPIDVSDEEWTLVAHWCPKTPCSRLQRAYAPQGAQDACGGRYAAACAHGHPASDGE